MKIAYIANVRLPTERAHGIQIMKTCEAFADAGHDVTLVVPRRKNVITADPFEYYRVQENFKIARIPTIDLVRFGKIGFFIQTVIFSELAAWYIRWNIPAKPDRRIIYSRDVWPLANVSLLGWNIFWEAHVAKRTFFARWLLKRVKGLVVISGGLKNFYETLCGGIFVDQKNVGKKNIQVAHDAVDLKEFNVSVSKIGAREKLGLPLDAKIVMYVGLLDDPKGYKTLLHASGQADMAGIQTVIIGGGQKQILQLQKEYPQVTFLGYRPYTELALNQKAADVLVIPNSAKDENSNLHTSPMKLFAHMMSRVPIVASDIPSLREILDEKTAFFFSPDDAADLAVKIKVALGNPTEAQNRAEAAFVEVQKYSWQARAGKILKFVS